MFNSILNDSSKARLKSSAPESGARGWLRAAEVALSVGVAAEIGLVGKKIAFGAAIGGERGLLGLFLATVAVAIGLLALRELRAAELEMSVTKLVSRTNWSELTRPSWGAQH